MPAFEWVHVQLHQQKGMISLSPPTICNSAFCRAWGRYVRSDPDRFAHIQLLLVRQPGAPHPEDA
ncbi:Aldehyde dehydrogenase (plasmid) [Escherichia coli]|nr:Aldehyde dehydrogenase [Escherichia coli]